MKEKAMKQEPFPVAIADQDKDAGSLYVMKPGCLTVVPRTPLERWEQAKQSDKTRPQTV